MTPSGRHDLASLPEIASVEIFLVDEDYDPVRGEPSIAGTTLAKLTGEAAHRVARLWRSLPEGEQARCHLPRYGVRFLREGVPLLEAALCFRCNNVSIIAVDTHRWATFAANAPESQELLAVFRGHDPSPRG